MTFEERHVYLSRIMAEKYKDPNYFITPHAAPILPLDGPVFSSRSYGKDDTEPELDPIEDLAAGGYRHDPEWREP